MSNVLNKEQAAKLIKKQLRAGWSVEDYSYGTLTIQNMEFGYVQGMKWVHFAEHHPKGGIKVKAHRKGARWMKATAANILKAAQEVVDQCNALSEERHGTVEEEHNALTDLSRA